MVSSNVRSRSRLAVISRYSVSRTVRRSPSSGSAAPVVNVIVRMRLGPEAFDGAGLVRVYLDEILRAGHGQHGFDPLLDPGQLQRAASGIGLTIEIHEAADRRAVDVADRRKV